MNFKKLIGKNPLVKKLIHQKSKDQVQNYWKNPNDQEHNAPKVYLESKTKNTQILIDIVKEYFDNKETKILELGCNVGRNLNKLFENGFKNLYAVEINSEAIRLMTKSYPDTFSAAKIFESSIEDKIKDFSDNQFDLVFTMAVLMHVHSDSNWIFQHIARITKKNLIIMENENIKATKNFPRNYKKIFENLGLEEKNSFSLNDGYICRIFSRIVL